MKKKKFEFKDKTYYLLYNGNAMFKLNEIKGEKDLMQSLANDFDFICKAAEVLSEQGELMRRYEGFDNGEILKADELELLISPLEIAELRNVICNAILSGIGREINEEEEVDLSLAKAQKKTKVRH